MVRGRWWLSQGICAVSLVVNSGSGRSVKWPLLSMMIPLLIAAMVGCGCASPGSAGAQEVPSDTVNIILLMDHSESLKTTDPDENRLLAAQLFVELLDTKRDQVAIVSFAQEVQVLTCTAPDSGNCFSQDRDYLKRSITENLANDLIAEEGGTDLCGGLEVAYELLNQPDPDVQGNDSFIVLLTDGAPCNPDNLESTHVDRVYRRECIDLVEAHYRNAVVFALTFTSPDYSPPPESCGDPDDELMKTIAGRTGGWYRRVDDAKLTADLYIEILTRIRELDIASLEQPSPGLYRSNVPPGTEIIVAAVQGEEPNLEAVNDSGSQEVKVPFCGAPVEAEGIDALASCLKLPNSPERALVVTMMEPSAGSWEVKTIDERATSRVDVLAERDWSHRLKEPQEGMEFEERSDIPIRVVIEWTNKSILSDLPGLVGAQVLDDEGTVVDSVELKQEKDRPEEFRGDFELELPEEAEEGEYVVVPHIEGLEPNPESEGVTIKVLDVPPPSLLERLLPWLIVAGLAAIVGLVGYSVFLVPRFPSDAVLVIGTQTFPPRRYAGLTLFRGQRLRLGETWPFDLGLDRFVCEIRASRSHGNGAVVDPGGNPDVRLNDERLEQEKPLYYGSKLSGQGWSVDYDQQELLQLPDLEVEDT